MKVLVVDDYSTMRRIIRNLLTQIGYSEIDEAADGNEALAKLRAVHYGLVLHKNNCQPSCAPDRSIAPPTLAGRENWSRVFSKKART